MEMCGRKKNCTMFGLKDEKKNTPKNIHNSLSPVRKCDYKHVFVEELFVNIENFDVAQYYRRWINIIYVYSRWISLAVDGSAAVSFAVVLSGKGYRIPREQIIIIICIYKPRETTFLLYTLVHSPRYAIGKSFFAL